MNVLMITGDKKIKPGHERFDLQASAVERLEAVYWGRGSLLPRVSEGHFDVVTTQDPFWRGLVGWLMARRLRARLNVQVHADLQGQGAVKHMLAQVVLRHADSIRVVSEAVRKQVENIGVHAPIHVLPVYIDIEKFKNISREPHEHKTILWFGRFEPEKGPLKALQVLHKVRTHVDAKLVMLGVGSLEPLLKVKAASIPVEFPGWQDPAPYLSRADVVLSTSLHESFGASIVEALAAGVPVVAPDVGVAHEAGAFVVPSEHLAEKIVEVLQKGQSSALNLNLLAKDAWAAAWARTLQ